MPNMFVALCGAPQRFEHEVSVQLCRHGVEPSTPDAIAWNPSLCHVAQTFVDLAGLPGYDFCLPYFCPQPINGWEQTYGPPAPSGFGIIMTSSTAEGKSALPVLSQLA